MVTDTYFTVIIPSTSSSGYRVVIDSIIRQKYYDFQLICGYDLSNLDILQKYEAFGLNILLFEQGTKQETTINSLKVGQWIISLPENTCFSETYCLRRINNVIVRKNISILTAGEGYCKLIAFKKGHPQTNEFHIKSMFLRKVEGE